jgi:hypothetical protein
MVFRTPDKMLIPSVVFRSVLNKPKMLVLSASGLFTVFLKTSGDKNECVLVLSVSVLSPAFLITSGKDDVTDEWVLGLFAVFPSASFLETPVAPGANKEYASDTTPFWSW